MTLWSFVTDVEGNFDYWERFIALSVVLKRNKDGNIEIKDDCGFIFGGDSVDKGNGDIRFVRDLLQLKSDYPTRVFFIIGNRDSNKLRFAAELVDKEAIVIPKFKRASWFPTFNIRPYKQFLEENLISDCLSNRAKWMLEETMGSETTFQLRKEELQLLGYPYEDKDVAQSFLDSISPSVEGNFMLQYLKQAQIMLRVGNTLFVHGGVNDINIGTVPGDSHMRPTVDEWAAELNAWCLKQLDEYEQQMTWTQRPSEFSDGERGGSKLIEYGLPGGNENKTVIYAYHLPNGNAEDLSDVTANYLAQSGIHRVIVGHQPHGDCPSVISTNPSVQVITGDTSYSDVRQADNRGCAVSEILLDEDSQVIEVHGILNDGRSIRYKLSCPNGSQVHDSPMQPDELIGKQLKDNFWVKSKLAVTPGDGREYMICKGSGYTLKFDYLTAAEVRERMR